ncbi:MAG: hypothetical protein QHJ73_16340, partial [Armatimonadota bacterium]|nr:hypothetical protein [Armatimonadota bacterium]
MRRILVDFSIQLRPWDGFGINYVETAQTRDYHADPQDYGGFSILSEEDRYRVVDLIFGDDGLRPGVAKMFLDPFHQPQRGQGTRPDGRIDLSAYDHTTTTRWMRFFINEGLKRTRERGGTLQVIVTLYGPPAWMTRQRFVRGRDLDPAHADDCARYLVSWAKYLREVEDVPVCYVSLHNEGEDWRRWPAD